MYAIYICVCACVHNHIWHHLSQLLENFLSIVATSWRCAEQGGAECHVLLMRTYYWSATVVQVRYEFWPKFQCGKTSNSICLFSSMENRPHCNACHMFNSFYRSGLSLKARHQITSSYFYMPPYVCVCVCVYIYIQVFQEECSRPREGVPYGKVYWYNPKHLCPKLNGYGDNGQRKVWYSSGSMHYTYQLTRLISVCPWVWCHFASHQQLLMHRQECDVRVCQSTVVGNPKATMTQVPAFL
jgi:hypothetical protein